MRTNEEYEAMIEFREDYYKLLGMMSAQSNLVALRTYTGDVSAMEALVGFSQESIMDKIKAGAKAVKDWLIKMWKKFIGLFKKTEKAVVEKGLNFVEKLEKLKAATREGKFTTSDIHSIKFEYFDMDDQGKMFMDGKRFREWLTFVITEDQSPSGGYSESGYELVIDENQRASIKVPKASGKMLKNYSFDWGSEFLLEHYCEDVKRAQDEFTAIGNAVKQYENRVREIDPSNDIGLRSATLRLSVARAASEYFRRRFTRMVRVNERFIDQALKIVASR